jgi:hypothetical protein
VTTDEGGGYDLGPLPPGEIKLRVWKQGYRSEERVVAVAAGARADVELSRGLGLSGIFLADDEGVPGGRITAASQVAGTEPQTALTDATGRFTLSGLAPGRYTIVGYAEGAGQARLEDVDAESAGLLRLVTRRQEKGVVIGTVTGAGRMSDADPPMVTVSVGGAGGMVSAIADAAGRFRIEDAPAGRATITATVTRGSSTRGSRPRELEVVAGSETTADVEMPAGAVVSGRITARGEPVARASVSLRSAGNAEGSRAGTDRDGRYSATVDPGRYLVAVSADGLVYQAELAVEGDVAADFDVTGGTVAGRVVDAGTRAPVRDVEVNLWPAAREYAPRGTATTDGGGQFEVPVQEGRYRLVTEKDGYAPQVREMEISRGGRAELLLELQAAEGLTLSVTDARDGSLLRAGYLVRDASRQVVASGRTGWGADPAAKIALAPGEYLLTVSAYGYAARTVRLHAPAGELAVPVTPGGTLVVEAGTPAYASARLRGEDGEAYVTNEFDGRSEIELAGRRTTVEHVAPGRYTLAGVVGNGEARPVPVVIQEGQVTTVTLE